MGYVVKQKLFKGVYYCSIDLHGDTYTYTDHMLSFAQQKMRKFLKENDITNVVWDPVKLEK